MAIIDVLGRLVDRIMNKDNAHTFSRATDSLEAIRDFLSAGGAGSSGLCYYGVITAVGLQPPGDFQCDLLIGHGNDFFAGYYAYIVWDADGLSAAPQGEFRPINDYISASGWFTLDSLYTQNLAIGDEVLILHPALVAASHVVLSGVSAAGSDADTLVDPWRTEINNYWRGLQLGIVTGLNAGLVRPIVESTLATTSIEVRPAFPFAIGAGERYVILARYTEIVPATNGPENFKPGDVIGNKTDTAITVKDNVSSAMRYLKGLMDIAPLSIDPAVDKIWHPFAKGTLTLDGVQYSAEVAGIGNDYTAIETIIITQPTGYTLEEIEFGLTMAVKSSGAVEGVNWKWQASDAGAAWQDLIAEQLRAASAAAYLDVSCSGRFAPTGNFLGTGATFQVRAVVKSAVVDGETAAGKTKNSSYILCRYRKT